MFLFNRNKFWLIPVPAAAVIQEKLTLFIVIGRKGYVDGVYLCFIKTKGNF